MTDFGWTRDQFHLPLGMIYLDGNSLGPLPKATPARLERLLSEEWGEQLISLALLALAALASVLQNLSGRTDGDSAHV